MSTYCHDIKKLYKMLHFFFKKPPSFSQVKYTHNYIINTIFNFLGGKVLASMCYFKLFL